MNRRRLDTSNLGPIRVEPPRHTAQARQLLADAIESRGQVWRNTADSIRTGGWGNAFTEAALAAIDKALRIGPEHDDEADE